MIWLRFLASTFVKQLFVSIRKLVNLKVFIKIIVIKRGGLEKKYLLETLFI